MAVNQVLAHFRKQEFAEAELSCRRLLTDRPDDPRLYALLGSIMAAQGDHRGALGYFNGALARGLDDFTLQMNRGLAAKRLDEWAQAEAAFASAMEWCPDKVEARFELANVKRLRGDYKTAHSLYSRVIARWPDFAEAHAALALVYEQQHDLEAAMASAEAALKLEPSNVTSGLVLARLALRRNRPEDTRGQLQGLIAKQQLTPQNSAYALNLLGQACEQCQDYDSAFAYFSQAKLALRALYDSKDITGRSIYSPQSIDAIRSFFEQKPVRGWTGFHPEQPRRLAFLVGFPRSGTTLLDQILASHPRIQTIEEQPTLSDAMQDLLSSPKAMSRLPDLSAGDIRHYRSAYLRRAHEHLPVDFSGMIVDKLPLNTVVLGLIFRLFPEARVIWAIRDPRAVVLSCFKQNFGPNDAMANMLSLQSISEYYAAVMGLGLHFYESLPLNQRRIRYEDLVDDLEGETRRLLEFLGLDWNPTVLEYRQTAKHRRINTPSYQQVVKPIYKSSKARWRDYAQHLESVMATLEPYIKHYGYLIDSTRSK